MRLHADYDSNCMDATKSTAMSPAPALVPTSTLGYTWHRYGNLAKCDPTKQPDEPAGVRYARCRKAADYNTCMRHSS
jgi:hypothetical protein